MTRLGEDLALPQNEVVEVLVGGTRVPRKHVARLGQELHQVAPLALLGGHVDGAAAFLPPRRGCPLVRSPGLAAAALLEQGRSRIWASSATGPPETYLVGSDPPKAGHGSFTAAFAVKLHHLVHHGAGALALAVGRERVEERLVVDVHGPAGEPVGVGLREGIAERVEGRHARRATSSCVISEGER